MNDNVMYFVIWMSSINGYIFWPQTYDGYSALHTQNSMYLNGGILSVECESWV